MKNKVVRNGFLLLLGLFFSVPSCQKASQPASLRLQEERLLVWEDPDSAWAVLQKIDTLKLPARERAIYSMECQLAISRMHHTPYYTEAIEHLLPVLEESGDALAIGEAYYMLGMSSNHTSHYEASTAYLKQAEEWLTAFAVTETDNLEKSLCEQLLGVTWFCLGNNSESEMLYRIAQNYYQKAIPLLEKRNNGLFLACAYRDMARTNALSQGEADSTRMWFDKAVAFAKKVDNSLLAADIAAYYYTYCEPDSVNKRLSACRLLAETYGVATRNAEIVEIYLAKGQTDSAAIYLDRLQPSDSTYSYWFEQNHAYLSSKLLSARNQNGEAYEALLELYDKSIAKLQRDASARTFAIAQHYDVEREQKKVEEAERVEKWHRQLLLILLLVLALTILLSVILYLYYRAKRREQAMQMKSLQDKYVQQLQFALGRLQQQVSLTREIELQRMRGNEVEFPKWLQTYRDEKLVMNKESLNELIASIDKALNGAVSRLRSEYPELTESDMQFAILSIIGATDNDMSIVLNVQKQTVYHRRQIVRKHVNPEVEDIDSWLREYVLKV